MINSLCVFSLILVRLKKKMIRTTSEGLRRLRNSDLRTSDVSSIKKHTFYKYNTISVNVISYHKMYRKRLVCLLTDIIRGLHEDLPKPRPSGEQAADSAKC